MGTNTNKTAAAVLDLVKNVKPPATGYGLARPPGTAPQRGEAAGRRTGPSMRWRISVAFSGVTDEIWRWQGRHVTYRPPTARSTGRVEDRGGSYL
jgi:hypothetical protein